MALTSDISTSRLDLGPTSFDITTRALVMGILNRTPDSFYDKGATWGFDEFLRKAESHVLAGADLLDVGGVKAGPGEEVTVAEELGVELRGGYYDHSGVLRDMVQNHILSVLSLIAMEPPSSISGDSVRNEKVKVLEAIRPMQPEDVISNTVRGQYGAGLIDGKRVPPYRSEPDVNPQSNTETFVAMKLHVENWRWAEVPFFIRSGKRLKEHTTQVVIGFRRTPLLLFGEDLQSNVKPNRLVLHVQPDEGITMDIHAKRPGPNISLVNVPLDFSYKEFGEGMAATGYETLLYDCMIGETTLFHRYDSVDASWRIVTPILDVWQALPARDFPNYESGSWGPAASDHLLEKSGHEWHHYPLKT